jgi:hypothetical protein
MEDDDAMLNENAVISVETMMSGPSVDTEFLSPLRYGWGEAIDEG